MPLGILPAGRIDYRSAKPFLRFSDIEVHRSYQCPNFRCDVDTHHMFQDFTPVPVQPPCVPQLLLRRFPTNINPFPKTNRWEVMQQPPCALGDGTKVFLVRYGVVTLKGVEDEAAMEKEKVDWKVFRCVKESGVVVAEVVAKEKWCKKGKSYGKFRFIDLIFL